MRQLFHWQPATWQIHKFWIFGYFYFVTSWHNFLIYEPILTIHAPWLLSVLSTLYYFIEKGNNIKTSDKVLIKIKHNLLYTTKFPLKFFAKDCCLYKLCALFCHLINQIIIVIAWFCTGLTGMSQPSIDH